MTAARAVGWEHQVDLHQMLAELTRPHQHREHYTTDLIRGTRWTRDHVTRVPALIHQLEHASPSGEGLGRSKSYESRPAARVEALDVLAWIDNQSSTWVKKLGEDDPGTTIGCLDLLDQLADPAAKCEKRFPKPGCCHWHDLNHDVRRWWTQARIVTGWDTAPWRPDVSCPICGKRGGLRIRLAERVGMCVECKESWDPASYQQLGDHVRAESEAKRRLLKPGPCWCAWPPEEPIPGASPLYGMCPRCGSARCRHAVRLVQHQEVS